MKRRMVLFVILILFCLHFFCGYKKEIKIGYVPLSKSQTAEDRSVMAWFEGQGKYQVHIEDITQCSSPKSRSGIFWIHAPDSSAYYLWASDPDHLKKIRLLYENGGRFLLTGFASLLPFDMGVEKQKPEIRYLNIRDDWLFDEKGFQSRFGHPVFYGLFGGAFVMDGYENSRFATVGFFDERYPADGKVIAVEKSYITIHGDRRLVIEYKSNKGRLLAIGGFIRFDIKNRLDFRMKKFLENCFDYLEKGSGDVRPSWWKPSGNRPESFPVQTERLSPSRQREFSDLPETGLLIHQTDPSDNYIEVAGRRVLVMGKEKGGLDEVWVHPLRILRDYRAGLVDGNAIRWLDAFPCDLEIRPESLIRSYRTSFGEIREIVFPSMDRAGFLIHYECESGKDIRLAATFRSDLRWMWPYDEKALGSLHYGYDSPLNGLHVKDETGRFYCLFGSDRSPEDHIEGPYSELNWTGEEFQGDPCGFNQVCHGMVFDFNPSKGSSLNLAFAGTNQGQKEALSHYKSLLKDPAAVYEKTVRHYQNVLESFTLIETPDQEFNDLWKWSLIGTDRFWIHTPPLGTALVAGHGTTQRGWDGGHQINGRPGYSWYFGRDACWSAFAVDDYGDFENVRRQLTFFQKFQDLSGKIFHEISTSGAVHYDAADATPLYVILSAHYLKASGDLKFIRQSWLQIQKAMDFLYSTDTDGDGLIENTNVGHGWVEGGKLWGAHTTFYLAGLWAQALEDAAYLAGLLGENDLSEKYAGDAVHVRQILNKDFWNERDTFYYYGMFADGSYNPEKTILPAVAMYYSILDREKVIPVLHEYAGNGFTSDWGVRILSSGSPLFNPRGYHYGSVWPLYTGWAALAEYTYGRSAQGFSRIYQNMMIKNYWSPGFVEEVMNGVEYKPAGVCSHQCWSETNILHPGITGLIGWKPNAPEKTAELLPRFPVHWDQVRVHHLRIGNSVIGFEMDRSMNITSYVFSKEKGKSIQIRFAPEIPQGQIIDQILVRDVKLKGPFETDKGLLKNPVMIDINGDVHVTFRHHHGIGPVPMMPRPVPGGFSQGYRIVSASLDGNRYILHLEGKSGTENLFRIRIFDQKIRSYTGCEVRYADEQGIVTLAVPFPESGQAYSKKQIRLILE